MRDDGIDAAQMRALEKTLRNLGDEKAAKKVLRKATKRGGWEIAREARKLAPKDTGEGAKQLKPRPVKSKGWISHIVSSRQLAARAMKGFYMFFQDRGYVRSQTKVGGGERKRRNRFVGPKKPTGREVEGKHFIDQAEDRAGDRVLRRVLDAAGEYIEKQLQK